MEDAGVGLGVARPLRGDHHLEERGEAGDGEPRALDAIEAVRHDPQPKPLSQLLENRSTAGQTISPPGEMIQVRLAETPGEARVGPDLHEELPKALAGEMRRGDLAPAIRLPQRVVDPAVGDVDGSGERQAQRVQCFLERDALGPVVIEKGSIDVEEDGAEAGQGPTWRGR